MLPHREEDQNHDEDDNQRGEKDDQRKIGFEKTLLLLGGRCGRTGQNAARRPRHYGGEIARTGVLRRHWWHRWRSLSASKHARKLTHWRLRWRWKIRTLRKRITTLCWT